MASSRSSSRSSKIARRSLATAVLLVGLTLLVTGGVPESAAKTQSDTVQVDPGEHGAVQIDFREGPTKDVRYDVQVQQGPNIDVMVLDNANGQRYSEGESFEYVGEWSDLDTGNTQKGVRLDTHGTWWLLLDHTDRPEGGASPATIRAESVTARYTLEVQTNVTDTARDRLDRLPGPGALGAAAAIGLVACAAARRR